MQTRKQQRQKRIPAVAPRPQTGSTEVIQQQKRISQHINPQIKRRRVKDFLRRPDQPQQGRRSNLPQKQSNYADAHGKPHCRLHCSGQLFRFVSPDVLCNQNICPDGSPEDTVTIRAMISVFVPTAASAFALPK